MVNSTSVLFLQSSSSTSSDLVRLSFDSASPPTEFVLVAGLPTPTGASSLSVQANGVAVWSSQSGWPSLFRIDSTSLVPGQRPATITQDPTATLSYGAVAQSPSGDVFVSETTTSTIQLFNLSSGLLPVTVKSPGFPVTGLSVSSNGTQLWWIAANTTGGPPVLFTGAASGPGAAALLDLSQATPPSTSPSVLAVSDRFGVGYWVDSVQGCVYRFVLPAPSAANTTQLCFGVGQRAVGVTIDALSGSAYVSLAVGASTTRLVLLAPGFAGVQTTLLVRPGLPCCGMVGSVSAFPTPAQTCAAGTYAASCLPCPANTFATSPLASSCSAVCNSSQFCQFAAASPIPKALAVNSSYSAGPLFDRSVFGESSIPVFFLIAVSGFIVLVALVLALVFACCRHHHYETQWPRMKRCCMSIDVFFRSRHYNETPAVMIHRKSVSKESSFVCCFSFVCCR